jgi:hypothetical protein
LELWPTGFALRLGELLLLGLLLDNGVRVVAALAAGPVVAVVAAELEEPTVSGQTTALVCSFPHLACREESNCLR